MSRDLESFRNTSEKRMARLTEQVAQLAAAVNIDAENIRSLARITEAHDRRLSDLESQM